MNTFEDEIYDTLSSDFERSGNSHQQSIQTHIHREDKRQMNYHTSLRNPNMEAVILDVREGSA